MNATISAKKWPWLHGRFSGGTVPNARYGINVTDDVLVNQTADGVNLNAVWDEFRDLLNWPTTSRSP